MVQRTINIDGKCIHMETKKIGVKEYVELSLTLWNDDSEIPEDWHDEYADHIELNLIFTVDQIVNDLIFMNSIRDRKYVFHIEEKTTVDLMKKEFESALSELNKIKFLTDEELEKEFEDDDLSDDMF